MQHEILIQSLSGLEAAASEFLRQTEGRNLIAFYAPMGAGKTTFITALCHVLGVRDDAVASPTFAIVNEYLSGSGESIYHFDFYRITKDAEALDIGLYDYLDSQTFFVNPVEHKYRSMMNVTFTSPNPDMDKKFCAEAAKAGFVNLKGHRLVGGMRASIYNAMPSEGVDKLVQFMEDFRKANA